MWLFRRGQKIVYTLKYYMLYYYYDYWIFLIYLFLKYIRYTSLMTKIFNVHDEITSTKF
jgi:hypothetical protein